MRNLDAQAAVSEWMRRIAANTDGAAAIVDVDEHGACIRTIVRADGVNRFHRLPFSSAAFFMAATRASRRWYKDFSLRGFLFARAYAVSNGSATVLSM